MEKVFNRISMKASVRLAVGLTAMLATCFPSHLTTQAAEPAVAIARTANSSDATDRVGLVRNWESTLPIGVGDRQGSEIKFVIPANSHPAFYLDRAQLDQLLTDPAVSDAERERFLGHLDVWVVLTTPNQKEVVSSRDRGVHGRVLGIDGALELANIRKEMLTAQGMEVTEEVRFIPHAVVFALNDSGSLYAMDAETGKELWNRRLSRGSAPIQGYAVSDHTVAVVNGSKLELYDAMTGTLLKERAVSLLPLGPPAIAGDDILVPGANGRIEMLIPFGERGYRSARGGFSGRLHMPMTALSRSYVWGVEDKVFVSDRLNPARPLFRIPTPAPQEVPPVGVGNLMILPKVDGQVDCFTQTSGLHAWTTFIGQEVVQQPVIVELPSQAPAAATESTDNSAAPADNGQEADPFGSDASDDEDPFGNPSSGSDAGEADPFGSDTPAAGTQGQDEDPFGSDTSAQETPDPFAAGSDDPFASSDDPFGGSGDSPFSGGFDTIEEESTGSADGDFVRQNRQVDMNSSLPTQQEVRVLLVTESGELVALDVRTGDIVQSFRSSNIQKVLTVTSRTIYALTHNNQLVALDARSGISLGAMSLSPEWHGVTNTMSDRVYLQSDNGQVLCLRPQSSPAPRYAIPVHLERREIRVEAAEAAETTQESSGDEFDIFGGGDGEDPFGSGDPFGSSDDSDPFGG